MIDVEVVVYEIFSVWGRGGKLSEDRERGSESGKEPHDEHGCTRVEKERVLVTAGEWEFGKERR